MKSSIGIVILTLILGIGIGSSLNGSAQAEETTPVSVAPQGDLLKICIKKKTGTIRASSTCKKAERSYVLGGPGPQGNQGIKGETGLTGSQGAQGQIGPQGIQGIKGEIGLTGLQGVQGQTGPIGATGTVSGLRTATIDYLAGPYTLGCNGFGPSVSIVSGVSVGYGGSLNVSKSSIQGCSKTVYVP